MTAFLDFKNETLCIIVEALLKHHNIPYSIKNTTIFLKYVYSWLSAEEIADVLAEKELKNRAFPLIGIRKIENGYASYFYFEIPKSLETKNLQTLAIKDSTKFHEIMDKLIHNNVKGYFDFPNITLEKPYFWKIIDNQIFLQKSEAEVTIAEFKQ